MSYLGYILTGLFAWTVISIMYFWFVLFTRPKFEPDHWYDYPFAIPTLVIAYAIGYLQSWSKK